VSWKTALLRWPQRASSSKSEQKVRRLQTLEQALAGESDFVDLLRTLLQPDPTSRPSCAEALNHRFFSSRVRQEYS
jgi:serine/threonine protein kinase